MRADGVEIVLVPDCDEADLDKWFRYLSNEVPGVMQLLAPGLPWPKPPADGGLGIEDWIYAKSPSNEQILAAISSMGDSGLSSNEKNLVTLEEKIQTIVDKHEDPLTRSALVKKEASELGFSLAAAEVNSFIRQAGYKEPVLYGEDVDMPDDSEAELWGNLLLYGSSNLVVAAPKVGKTSLITHIMGCIMSRKSHCLDQPIHNLCDHFIILGSDMARKQWKKLILKEGLGTIKPNGKINMPNIKLATKGTKLDLSREGLKYIVGLCVARPNAMLVVDCLRTYSDGDENTRDFIAPIDRLMVALAEADCKTTVICIHHARKSGGATAIEAASGHSSITSAFDQTLNMNWLNPADTEILQRDKRIVVTSSGRGEDQSIVVEQVGPTAKWVNHGNAEDLIKAEAIIKAEEALTSQQVKVYDQGQTIYENTGKGLKARAVMELLQCSRQAARRYLATLHRKGLFIRTGQKGAEGYKYYPHWAERTEEGSASSLPSADLGGGATLRERSIPLQSAGFGSIFFS
ncbi:AAA family ATPase [Synechococcus lacustris Tous-12m]